MALSGGKASKRRQKGKKKKKTGITPPWELMKRV